MILAQIDHLAHVGVQIVILLLETKYPALLWQIAGGGAPHLYKCARHIILSGVIRTHKTVVAGEQIATKAGLHIEHALEN